MITTQICQTDVLAKFKCCTALTGRENLNKEILWLNSYPPKYKHTPPTHKKNPNWCRLHCLINLKTWALLTFESSDQLTVWAKERDLRKEKKVEALEVCLIMQTCQLLQSHLPLKFWVVWRGV